MPPEEAPRGRYFSVSAVTRYEVCPQAFKFDYVDRIKRPESTVPEHWRFGSVVHAGFEALYALAKAEGLELPVDDPDVDARLGEAVRAAWSKYEMPEHGGELDRAIGMVLEGTSSHPPLRPEDILGVEMKLVRVTADGTIVVGYADLITRADPETVRITDHKITSKLASREKLTYDLQGNTYAWMAGEEFPWATRVLFEHHYPPVNERVEVEVDPEGAKDAVSRIEAIAEAVEMDAEFKPRVSEECEYCNHQAICPAWKSVDGQPTALQLVAGL